MKLKITLAGLLMIAALVAMAGRVQEKFDRVAFYNTMASGKLDAINAELEIVRKSTAPEKEAFEGTLLMKKAGIISGPGKKLNLFKAGHKKLEAEIKKDSSNAELRFLRLMIQENAPGILGYKDELQKDRQYIRKNFNKLLPAVQHAVTDYSKKSKVLTSADF
jgi:hypothetical protein